MNLYLLHGCQVQRNLFIDKIYQKLDIRLLDKETSSSYI